MSCMRCLCVTAPFPACSHHDVNRLHQQRAVAQIRVPPYAVSSYVFPVSNPPTCHQRYRGSPLLIVRLSRGFRQAHLGTLNRHAEPGCHVSFYKWNYRRQATGERLDRYHLSIHRVQTPARCPAWEIEDSGAAFSVHIRE